MDSKDINFSPKNASSLKNVTRITRPTNKYKSDESKRISVDADKKRKRQKRKHRNLNYNYKSSGNRKYETWKKLKDVKKAEVKQEGILDVDKSRNKVPPDQMTTNGKSESNGKSELPTTNNHSEESPHEPETKHSKSKNISGNLIRKKKNKTDASSTRNDPKQKHNKRHHGTGIKEKSIDSEIAEGIDEKPDPAIDKTTKTEVANTFKQGIKKLVELNSKSSSVKDSKRVNKLRKDRTKKKKSEKELAKTEKTSGANKAKRTTVKEKSLNGSGTDSESITGSEKKEKKKKAKKLCGKKGRDLKSSVKCRKSSQKIRMRDVVLKEKDRSISGKQSESISESAKKKKRKKIKSKERKTKKLSGDLYESERIRNKKKAKKGKNTSKSMREQCKIKKRKAKKVKSHHIHKGKDENEINNKKIKLEEEKEKMRGRGIRKSKSNEKLNFHKKMKRVDEILKSGSEKENKEMETQEKLSSRRKMGKRKRERETQEDQRREDKSSEVTKRSISIFAALSEKEQSDDNIQQTDQKDSPTGEEKEQMAAIEKQSQQKMKKHKVNDMTTPKRISHGMKKIEESNNDAAQRREEPAVTVMSNKIKEKKVMGESSPSNVVLSSTSASISCSDQDANSSPETEDNEANKSQERSYVDGLVQIRTILEIYGIDEQKTEAFNKLLDEDISMTEKEIAANLRKAVCDLPMDKELLEKVLKKMQFSGLLRKQEHEMLEKNLVPQAVNESVTIALLAQVLQRQKLKKSIS
uniref:Bm9815, isoform d n=1 Tax=Brugia malayi TaxID=6279 RepID=A0A1P6CHU2_BRUMA|nr:Bm9815, isoform d [Brugia malayi]